MGNVAVTEKVVHYLGDLFPKKLASVDAGIHLLPSPKPARAWSVEHRAPARILGQESLRMLERIDRLKLP